MMAVYEEREGTFRGLPANYTLDSFDRFLSKLETKPHFIPHSPENHVNIQEISWKPTLQNISVNLSIYHDKTPAGICFYH